MSLSTKLAAAAVALLAAAPGLAVVQGDVFPTDVSVKHHAATNQLDAESLKGKVTIVNFWATWCAACKVELVEMEDMFRPLISEKNFNVAYVSLDKDPADAVEWFRSNLKEPDVMLKSLFVDQTFAVADRLAVDAFPMTLIIDQNGKVVHVQRGFKEGDGSTAELAKMAGDLLRR